MELTELHPELFSAITTGKSDFISVSDSIKIIRAVNQYIQITDWRKRKYSVKEIQDHVLRQYKIPSRTIHKLLFDLLPVIIEMIEQNDKITVRRYRNNGNYLHIEKKYYGSRIDSKKPIPKFEGG